MGLQDAFEAVEGDDSSAPQATHFKINNPNHPDSPDEENSEVAEDYFRAARFLQDRLGSRRNDLIGRFAYAIYESEVNENSEPLEELYEDLSQ